MKIGIIKEGKIPHDNRVPLTPAHCRVIQDEGLHQIVVQSSNIRCFTDDEYVQEGISVVDDVSNCDLLLGVKEVPLDHLVPGKTYMFFSHTIKEQEYNRDLLKTILKRKIRLIDYETIVDDHGKRLIAFGKFAGMVGAHNGVMTYGSRSGLFALNRMNSFLNYSDAVEAYKTIEWPRMRIVLTGTGRVGNGAAAVLRDMGIRELNANDFLMDNSSDAIFTQLNSEDYIQHKEDKEFITSEYYEYPERFKINFKRFYAQCDIFINGIYWDNKAPKYFSVDEMLSEDFKIQVIADVTCDIAPDASVPSTLRASTIEEPVFGYEPKTQNEVDPFQPDAIDVMSIDNLPNELPRDASMSFGQMFVDHVLPEFGKEKSRLISEASITTCDGMLGEHFNYLTNYVSDNSGN